MRKVISTVCFGVALILQYLGGIALTGLFFYGIYTLFVTSMSLGLMMIGAGVVGGWIVYIVAGVLYTIGASALPKPAGNNQDSQETTSRSEDPDQVIPGALNTKDQEQFSSISDLVKMQMAASCIMFTDHLSKMTQEQEKKYFAYELGVIEYHYRMYLVSTESSDSDIGFVNFMIYYANQKYDENAEAIFEFWNYLVTNELMTDTRKLGFDSINNQVNEDGTKKEGHFPGSYLMRAVGFEL